MLQWGRGLSAAEILDRHVALLVGVAASMGPRPFSRGNQLEKPSTSGYDQSFNGAAAFQPRKSRHKRRRLAAVLALQWGRGLSAAEMTTLLDRLAAADAGFNGAAAFQPRKFRARRAASRGRLLASMGPRPFSRGNDASPSAHRGHRDCFNGAAAFQPRKSHGQISSTTTTASASMGPRPFSRGNERRRGSDVCHRPASMGPRPFSRGNLHGVGGWALLAGCFNGAAAFQPRKSPSVAAAR